MIETLGYEKGEELLGRPALDILHPAYRESAAQRITTIAQTGRPAPLLEEKILKKDGTPLDFLVTSAPITYFGKPAFEVSAVDITDRQQAEEALQTLNAELDERVRERTEELQKFVNLMVGREVRMAELKKVIKKLHAQLQEAGLTPVADDPLLGSKSGME